MKSNRGVTLTALVAYIVVFIIIITIMSFTTSNFFENIQQIKETPKYVNEFNTFCMFFIADIKDNKEIVNITENSLEFGDGTFYTYKNKSIYRNDAKIARFINNFTFTQLDYVVNNFTKKIINVNATIGSGTNAITRNIDFVLKYW